jgi:sugar phosphate isomerase/epimerase
MEKLKDHCKNLNLKLEVGSKGLSGDNLQQYIEIASLLDSKILRFVIDDASKDYEPSLSEVKDVIKKAEKELAARNIILAIENHDRFKAIEFADLIRDINSPFVGICLDCANSLGAGEGIYETVSILAPYTVNVHFKDISIQRKSHKMGFDINGVPFGQGIIPIDWVIRKMTSRCQTGILELWMPPEENWDDTFRKEQEWVERSLEYLRGRMGKDEG